MSSSMHGSDAHCPFCGGVFGLCRGIGGEIGVVHALPLCIEVEAMDPLSFMIEARKKLQAQAGLVKEN